MARGLPILVEKDGILSEGQAITASAESTNFRDFQVADPNKGEGDPIDFGTIISEDFAGTTGTIRAEIEHSDDKSGWEKLQSFEPIDMTALKKGTIIALGRLAHRHQRYVRAYYLLTGTAPTGGRVTTLMG